MRILLFVLLTATALQAQTSRTFTGVITDSECADGNHSRMRMGDTDPECVKACVEFHDGTYMLFDGKTAYKLSDQKASAAFAARKVTVTGTLDEKTKTIAVQSISANENK